MSASASSSNRFPEIPKYDLQEEIGHGGMATVYRACDQRLDRDVAVKVIHKHLRENAEVRRRFVAEAKAVAKLRHRGIVDVYDVSDEDQLERYLVVELIRGYSLRELLQDKKVLPPEIGATMVLRLCEAVQHAHEQGVIHRDIKPENVLIEPPQARDSGVASGAVSESTPPPDGSNGSGRRKRRVIVKLTDFGIAKVLDAQGVTSTGQILGSPAHMAPEQIEGGEVGPHTDVFALGVLFYECIVGHLPFEGKNPAQVLRRVLEGEYEPADAERPVVGGRWARILAGALAKDIELRTPTAAELGAQITAELEALGIESPAADLADYFEDGEAYAERMRIELVPRLLDRGEREKRAGHVPVAAADFNRALALQPDDMAILKRISSLSAQSLWTERGKRIGTIVVGSAALFGLAFGITKALRGVPGGPAATSSARAAVAPSVVDTGRADPDGSAAEVPSATTAAPVTDATATAEPMATDKPRVRPVSTGRPTPATSATSDAVADRSTRRVRFAVIPGGANLSIDGQSVTWFGKVHELSVGGHSVSATMDGPCCEDLSSGFEVLPPPEDEPDDIQTVRVSLSIKDAQFLLSGGPSDGSVVCKGRMSTGSPISVPMTDVDWTGLCDFSNDKKKMVTLRAGEVVTIPWPQ